MPFRIDEHGNPVPNGGAVPAPHADMFQPEIPLPILAAQWEARAHELLSENMRLRTVVQHQKQQLDVLRNPPALTSATPAAVEPDTAPKA